MKNTNQLLNDEPVLSDALLAALKNRIDLVTEENNKGKQLGWFFDGFDTYAATFWRCWFNFFLWMHLPNQWDNEGANADIGGREVNLTGPVGAIIVAATILLAGYWFAKASETRWLKEKLSDEFLLTYFALKKAAKNHSELQTQYEATFNTTDALIARQKRLDQQTEIGYWIYELLGKEHEEGQEAKRIRELQAHAEKNYLKIRAALAGNPASPAESANSVTQLPVESGKSALRVGWEKLYDGIFYYAYAHWLIWILGTVALYQTAENYGVNPDDPDHSNSPSFFNQDIFDSQTKDGLLFLQLGVPLIITIAALGYMYYREKTVEKKLHNNDDALGDNALAAVRGAYLKDKDVKDGPQPTKTHTQFNAAVISTGVTTFIGNFLLANIAAWPMSGFVSEVCDKKIPDEELILWIFSFTAAVALLQATLKVNDMRAENKKVFSENTNGIVAAQTPGWKDFYKQKQHWHQAAYFGIGRILGSGGLLLSRVLFSGGMGNFRLKDGDPSLKTMNEPNERMDILLIGLGLTAFMITLNLYQYYKATERQEAIAGVRDAKLKATP